MRDKLNIEQLFRKGLEGAELFPSPASWTGIKRKLRWKQFLRFRPGRFNVYYAGALLLAGTGIGLLLSGNEEPAERAVPNMEVTPESPTVERRVIRKDQAVVPESEAKGRPEIQPPEPGPLANGDPDTDGLQAFSGPEENLGEEMDVETSMAKDFTPPVLAVEPLKEIELEHLPAANFACSAHRGCAPLPVQFTDQSLRATSWHWDFGTGDVSREQHPAYVFREAGRYMVTLTMEFAGSQPTVSRMMIEVLESPVADFQIEEGLVDAQEHIVLNLLNYSAEAVAFRWSLVDEDCIDCSDWSSADPQPNLELKSITPDSRSVLLEVRNEQGCKDTAIQELPLIVQSSETRIKFPNAFSPNPSGPGGGSFAPGTNRIDLFHPIYLEVPVEFHLRIFTRRGELVFETRDLYQGWDGYHNQMPAAYDVYVWMADGRWKDGTGFSLHGDVTLVAARYW